MGILTKEKIEEFCKALVEKLSERGAVQISAQSNFQGGIDIIFTVDNKMDRYFVGEDAQGVYWNRYL